MTGVTAVSSVDTVGTATQFTGASITSGSANVTVSSTAGIRPGANVYGSGIPTGATVLSITSATVFVISANATDTIGSLTITIATVTDADLKLLTVNSGWYRDIYTPQPITLSAFSTSAMATMPTVTSILAEEPITGPNPHSSSYPGVVIGATTKPTNSDEMAHAALRQATWFEALWCFSCTVDAETLTCYYRKIDVIGWCNVAPSL